MENSLPRKTTEFLDGMESLKVLVNNKNLANKLNRIKVALMNERKIGEWFEITTFCRNENGFAVEITQHHNENMLYNRYFFTLKGRSLGKVSKAYHISDSLTAQLEDFALMDQEHKRNRPVKTAEWYKAMPEGYRPVINGAIIKHGDMLWNGEVYVPCIFTVGHKTGRGDVLIRPR